MKPATKDAFRLFHEGVQSLADIEITGLPVSLDRLRESSLEIKKEIRQLETAMRSTEVYGLLRNRFKKSTSYGSRDQLSWVTYDHYKIAGSERSDNGKYKLDNQIVSEMQENPDTPEELSEYLTLFSRVQKLQKLQSTYIDGLARETVNGRVHGFLGLSSARTYRGNADSPNLNNLPTRDAVASKYIKGAVVPRPGYHIVEIDYSGLEVSVAAFYHKDPTMIRIITQQLDPHTDFSEKAYFINKEWREKNKDLAKKLRYQAKTGVFAMQYGDVYYSVAKNLWKMTKYPEVRELLASRGITKLGVHYDGKKPVIDESPGTFVSHMKTVDNHYWNVLHPVYDQWRKDFWEEYQRKGYYYNYTGFRFHGVFKRNEVINAPVQSVGFHILLDAIIQINKEIKKRGMKSRVVLEIHDSAVSEVAEDELEEFIQMSKEIMIDYMKNKYDWMLFPLRVEVEHSEISWHDKRSFQS